MYVPAKEMVISPKTIRLANTVIQTRNVSEANLWTNWDGILVARLAVYSAACFGIWLVLSQKAFRQLSRTFIGFFHQFGIHPERYTGWALLISICLMLAAIVVAFRSTYELQLHTNSGKITALRGRDKDFIQSVIAKIQEAMSDSDSNLVYNVNVERGSIAMSHTNDFTNASGVNYVGDNNRNVKQSASVKGETLSDIVALTKLVRASSSPNKEELTLLLGDIRNYLSGGGKTKAEASSAWRRFVATAQPTPPHVSS